MKWMKMTRWRSPKFKCEEEALVRIREMLQNLKPGRKTPPPQCSKT